MKPADDIDDAHNADVQEKSEKTEEKPVGTATESVHEEQNSIKKNKRYEVWQEPASYLFSFQLYLSGI